jgi:hypothetical protein
MKLVTTSADFLVASKSRSPFRAFYIPFLSAKVRNYMSSWFDGAIEFRFTYCVKGGKGRKTSALDILREKRGINLPFSCLLGRFCTGIGLVQIRSDFITRSNDFPPFSITFTDLMSWLRRS